MADIKKLAEELVNLTVLEVNELKILSKMNTVSNQLLPLLLLLLLLPLLPKKKANLNLTSFLKTLALKRSL